MTEPFLDIKKYLSEYASASDIFLSKFFEKKKEEGFKIDPEIKKALEIFENYSLGGKKIRGALTVLGYQMAGGRDFEAILSVSCGIELLHNFLLIHDDVIDRDALRRGKPTVHSLYATEGKHVGFSKAIIVGDVGAFLGHELIVSSPFPKDKIVLALNRLDGLILKTMYGEMLDVDYDYRKNVFWEDVFRVRLYKTAFYTFVMPLSVGSTFSGASEETLKAIEAYGANVGIAFQINDDILGVFGDPKITGKSNASDIKEGKKTFLFTKALELAKSKDKAFLKKKYGKKNVTEADIERIRNIFVSSGSLDYSKNLASKLALKGKNAIKRMTEELKYRKTLTELADYVILRDK